MSYNGENKTFFLEKKLKNAFFLRFFSKLGGRLYNDVANIMEKNGIYIYTPLGIMLCARFFLIITFEPKKIRTSSLKHFKAMIFFVKF